MEKLNTIELAVHQLEHSMLTLFAFGGIDAVKHLCDLHSRILSDWGDCSQSGCIAVESIMDAIDVDDNGMALKSGLKMNRLFIRGEVVE